MTVTLVDADPDAGFNYPYYLHVPDGAGTDEPTAILVEPTNAPGASDDFDFFLELAQRRAAGGFGRRVADELSVPFLHPVFPRPFEEPVDWTHYTHSLDVETMRIRDGPLERIDRQLLEMVAHAADELAERGITVRDRFSMNGFSAAGKFVNRFAALHPDALISVTAGGINGTAILPIPGVDVESLKHPLDLADVTGVERLSLNYHVGVADLEAVTGRPFDLEAFRSVNQFLYLGEDDDNDALLHPDAWTGPELRLSAVLTYGEDIHDDRFPTCKAIYEDVGAAAVFRTYEDAGHTPEPAFDDVVEFHRRSLAGDDVADIRADLGGNVPESRMD